MCDPEASLSMWGWVSCFVANEHDENGGWEMSETGKMVEDRPAVNSLQSSLALGPKVPKLILKSLKLTENVPKKTVFTVLHHHNPF